MRKPEPDGDVGPLTQSERNDNSSEITYRRFMITEARRQTLLLQEIRDHFRSWTVEES